jgi:hypothetical protein
MSTRQRIEFTAAWGGAFFTILVVVAFLIDRRPSSTAGVDVVAYYSTHHAAALTADILIGIGAAFFILFAETFARRMASVAGLVGAAATIAPYLVAIGCWGTLAESYGGVDVVNLPREAYDNAHVVYVVGVGVEHMGHFAAAAFIAATAAALFATPARTVAWLGIAVAVFRLGTAVLELATDSGWSDVVVALGFLSFLAWTFAASATLAVTLRRGYLSENSGVGGGGYATIR